MERRVAMPRDTVKITRVTPEDWTFGRAEAAVTVLEYGDFECPHCALVRPVLQSVVATRPALIKLVFRHFPLTDIHPHSAMAAEAAEAAGAQSSFWEMHDLLFQHQNHMTYRDLRWHAQNLGLDLDRFDREMTEHAHLAKVRRDFRMGIEDGVSGTPTILINRRRYEGPRDRQSILEAINSQLPPSHVATA
jgi:protein-disulfide isomerase